MKYITLITIIVLFAMGIERRVHSAFIDNQLLHAIELNRADLVAGALASGADPNVATMSSSNIRYWNYFFVPRRAGSASPGAESALYIAVLSACGPSPRKQSVAIVRDLVQSGANVNQRCSGWPILMIAVETCGPDEVQAIVDGGADVNATADSNSALTAAMDRVPDFHGSDAVAIVNILLKAHLQIPAGSLTSNGELGNALRNAAYPPAIEKGLARSLAYHLLESR